MYKKEEINIKDYPYYRTIPVKSIGDKQKLIQVAPIHDMHQYPAFNMMKTLDTNSYKVEIIPQTEDLHTSANHDLENSQRQKVSTMNNTLIEHQILQINSNNMTIQSNNNLIHQQFAIYNNNAVILHNQHNQHSANNQILDNQMNQIVEYKEQIEQLQADLKMYQEQILYHDTMLNTIFNSCIPNPQLVPYSVESNPE